MKNRCFRRKKEIKKNKEKKNEEKREIEILQCYVEIKKKR